MNTQKPITLSVAILSLLLLSGCGGEGSEGNDAEKLNNVTDVSGKYTIITSVISVECTDGSTETLPAQAISGVIEHTGNRVEFINDDQGSVPGVTVVETDATDGVIETNGRFIMTSSTLATIEGIDGNLTVNYNLSGCFNDSGWGGEYGYSIFFQNYALTCTYSSPFSGTKS